MTVTTSTVLRIDVLNKARHSQCHVAVPDTRLVWGRVRVGPLSALVVSVLLITGCTSPDRGAAHAADPEETLAAELCDRVDAAASDEEMRQAVEEGFDAGDHYQSATGEELDWDRFGALVMQGCGEPLEGLWTRMEAAEKEREARWGLPDALVVEVDRCNDLEIAGTVTNGSEATILTGFLLVRFFDEAGAELAWEDEEHGEISLTGKEIGFEDPELPAEHRSLPALEPGATYQWVIRDHLLQGRPIARCEGWVQLEEWIEP